MFLCFIKKLIYKGFSFLDECVRKFVCLYLRYDLKFMLLLLKELWRICIKRVFIKSVFFW